MQIRPARLLVNLTVVATYLASATCFAQGTPAPVTIDQNEAASLVREAIKSQGHTIALDPESRKDDPGFFFFGATWPNPSGSPVIGYFAVNRQTGDVWDEGCRPVHSPSLTARQEKYRRNMHLSGDAYRALAGTAPIC